jgi:hypothetical protein
MNTQPRGPLAVEEKLGAAYAGLCQMAQDDVEIKGEMADLHYRLFDVKREEKRGGGIEAIPSRLEEAAGHDVSAVGVTVVGVGQYGRISETIRKQEGAFRVNCRGESPTSTLLVVAQSAYDPSLADCLDRTNLIEALLSSQAVANSVDSESYIGSRLEKTHRLLFAEVRPFLPAAAQIAALTIRAIRMETPLP